MWNVNLLSCFGNLNGRDKNEAKIFYPGNGSDY